VRSFKFIVLLVVLLVTFIANLTGLASADTTDASTYGSGNYGVCSYGSCSITLDSSTTVNANVTPSGSGKCTVQSDSVSVLTDNSDGYNLSMTTSSTSSNMASGPHTISASSGLAATPVTLAMNTWGFRVDGISGFGAGPTSAQTNGNTPSVTFAKVPANNETPAVLASTNSTANPAVNTTVWYGVCANTNQPSGSYAASVTYTAVTN
jgi:hypothetical protein